MQNVADNAHPQPPQILFMPQHSEGIEQRLRGMLVHAVAGVDHWNVEISRGQVRRAGRRMPHHNGIGPGGAQCVNRIQQRLALLDGTCSGRDQRGHPAQFLGG